MTSQFSLLKTRRFMPLFVTQLLGAFNDNAFKNAMVMLSTYGALTLPGVDAKIIVSAAAGIFILPFFLFSATAGQLADKYDKAYLIRVIKGIEIILMVFAAVAFHIGSLPMLLALLFCMGMHSTFFGPIKYSILPDHLAQGELVGANALIEAGTFLAILAGTIAGGVLSMSAGGIAVVSVLLVVAAVGGLFSARAVPSAPSKAPHLRLQMNIAAETLQILRHVYRNRSVWLSIVGISWFWLVGFTFLSQFPSFARDTLGGDETVVTLLLVVFSVGVAAGSLLCNRLLHGAVSARLVPFGAFGMSAAILLMWLALPGASDVLVGASTFLRDIGNWPFLAALFGVAVAGGVYIVPLYAIMQDRSEAEFRSRTIAANNIVNALFMSVASLACVGIMSLDVGVVEIFIGLAVLNIPVAVLVGRIVARRNASA